MSTALLRPEVTLDDKYGAESGPVLISGIQALVRLTLDQRRLDARRGLDTGVFVSGYQGSPLGGLDRELLRARRHLDPQGIVFQPGVNEELAATAVGGTQLLGNLAGRRHEGVTGFWFGKNPGLDRAADAIRHSTVSGTAPLGGAVAWIGDDPFSKSSTVPSSCEPMCRSLHMPLLAPGSVAEVLELGLHAVAISRHAGLWSGLKIVADIADASATVEAGAALDAVPEMAPREAHEPPILLPPTNLEAEHDLLTLRLERVHGYARAAELNRIVFEPSRPRLAVLAAGMGYQALLRALDDLGLDEPAREAAGLRLVRLGMPWPLDPGTVRRLAGGVETVMVVEDKLPFVEEQVKASLYGQPQQPRVLGKEDAEGRPLLPVRSGVAADDVAQALRRLLADADLPEPTRARIEAHAARQASEVAPVAEMLRRTPYFCSGCPHNVSTRAQPDQLVGVGIGCHIMVALDGDERRGDLLGMPQMGGEGAQWLGLAPFTDEPHFIQNLGDGTFHHSGSLAIRAAVAAGARITYRLLYNDAVAMTGGQEPEGNMPLPELIRWLAAEGVKRVVLTTPEPHGYRGVELDPIAEVRHRDDLQGAQRELAEVDGVTVLIHDDRCATEKRRLRKRGKLETPPQRVWINERVCEGCGDCGEKSTCLSVWPVETEFGRKTRIHQPSCNQDLTCLKGDCPSFLMVTPADGAAQKPEAPEPPANLPDPIPQVSGEVLVRMPGVGGTGVVTISAILQMAAHMQGLHAAGLEQIGLAQKGGPVVSDLRLAATPIDGQLRATRRGVDVLLGFDLLGAADAQTLAVLDPERTVAVLNGDVTPTASMITDPDQAAPRKARMVKRIAAETRERSPLVLDAEAIAERLFGDHMPANMVLVGAAHQSGFLPMGAEAIEAAIRLNGAAVDANLKAFRWGRAVVADPEALENALVETSTQQPEPATNPAALALLERLELGRLLPELLPLRVSELIAYQDEGYARAYAEEVARVARSAAARVGEDSERIAAAYARGLFKLMAYKDEYEVARLHLDSVERSRLEAEMGSGAKAQILLHPPLLRALGLKRKLRFGRSAKPMLRALRAGRRLRGTPLDPFGRAQVRRVERELVGEYRALVERALESLDAGKAELVAEVAELPELVRGYEEIKLANVERMRRRGDQLLDRLQAPVKARELAVTHRGGGGDD
jgi:indolepyruvate ferredoxin oxidoreductase